MLRICPDHLIHLCTIQIAQLCWPFSNLEELKPREAKEANKRCIAWNESQGRIKRCRLIRVENRLFCLLSALHNHPCCFSCVWSLNLGAFWRNFNNRQIISKLTCWPQICTQQKTHTSRIISHHSKSFYSLAWVGLVEKFAHVTRLG